VTSSVAGDLYVGASEHALNKLAIKPKDIAAREVRLTTSQLARASQGAPLVRSGRP
jgi:hypothetical protein